MSITSYAELKTAIAGWANRTDATAYLADFITLAEARLNDMLLLRDMESDEALTLTLNQNYVALPTGYISPIAFWLVVDGERLLLDPALPQEMPYDTSSTQPRYWAIDGENILFDCPAGDAYTAYLRCIKASNLSDTTTTNYLLRRRPDVYLSGAMVEFCRWAKDAAGLGVWEAKFAQACAGLKAADNRARGIVPLRSDIPIVRHRANIFRGD